MVLNPSFHGPARQALDVPFPRKVIDLINRKIDQETLDQSLIILSACQLHTNTIKSRAAPKKTTEQCIISLQSLNEIRFVNKFLEALNESLDINGSVVVHFEPSCERKQRILANYPWPLNSITYFFDYWVRRVWPKLPVLKRLYDLLLGKQNRVISEMEAIGRLYYCGFQVVDYLQESGRLYIVAKKAKSPVYSRQVTDGPFIKLKRSGYQGKAIKVYKIRTMFAYSEYLQEFIYNQQGLQSGGKIKDDPRVNKMGHFLRKYWLDELPMLINLLKGEIKIFGVRPISEHYLSLFPLEFQEYREQFKPGLIPPVYVEIPETLEDVVAIERRYLEAYERKPLQTDFKYVYQFLYNILFKKVRSH